MNKNTPLSQKPPKNDKEKKPQRTAEDIAKSLPPDPAKAVNTTRKASDEAIIWLNELVKISEDKTLKQNKLSTQKNIENDVIRGVASSIVQAEMAQAGSGYVAADVTALRLILQLRDRCNELEYRITQLEKNSNLKQDEKIDDKKQ